jgi:hypothetical protein
MTDQQIAEVGRVVADIRTLSVKIHSLNSDQLLDLINQLEKAISSNVVTTLEEYRIWVALVPALNNLFSLSVW